MNWSKFFFAMSAIFIAPHMTNWLAMFFGAFYLAIALFALHDEVRQ